MAKRKAYKQSRRKQCLDQSQESLLQKSDTSDEVNCVQHKYTPFKKRSKSTELLLHQRSPESVLFESDQPDLSCYDDLSPEIVPTLRRIKLDLNKSDKNEEERKVEQKGPELIEINQVNNLFKQNIDKSTEKCFPLDKTLSMNDEIKLEMNDCQSLQEEKSFSRNRLDIYSCNNQLCSSKSTYNFPCDYTSELTPQFTNFNSESEPQNGYHNFFDEFQTTISACESVGRYEEKWNGQDRDTRYEIVNEKNSQNSAGNKFINNWSECRRILSNLRHLNSLRVRTANQEFFGNLLPKYKKCDETRLLQISSLSYNTPSWKENSDERTNKRPFIDETDKIDNKVDDMRNYRKVESNTRIRARSYTPYSGSPPPAKRCRTTLKFDDEDMERLEKPVATNTVTDLLPMEKKNVQKRLYPKPTITKTPWSADSSESPTTLILDLPAMSNSGGCNKCLEDPTCASYHENKKFQRFRSVKKPIAKIVLFCVWMIKRITTVLKESYENFKAATTSTSTRRQMEELSQIVIKLRLENEQMINTFLDKVTRLSDQITQVRASNVSVIGTLTAEISGMQDITKKLVSGNETLMQELQRLQQALENTRIKSPKKPPSPPPPIPSVSLSSTPFAVFPPAPPPPPPPPPPPAPPLPFLPPPAPAIPPAKSPAQPITPITPSNGRSVRMPSRKCSTPLFNRPAITVEDLLKVTLKKAPQNVKENRRNTIPGPKGPVVSLDMLRSVKLKSARRRTSDQMSRSPRSGRILKTRTASSLSLSPIMKGTDNSLSRILKQVDINKRPRRLLTNSSSFRENIIGKDNQSQKVEASGSRSMIV